MYSFVDIPEADGFKPETAYESGEGTEDSMGIRGSNRCAD